jgi:MATE family multidrug resistance protein
MADAQELPLHHETGAQRARRSPLAELLILAAPTVAQMASYTVMQFVDRIMLAEVSDLHATAAGTAGLTYFCVIGFGFGVLLVVNTLVSQSFGRKDLRATGQYLWQGLWFGVAFGFLTLVLWPIAPWLFRVMGHEPNVAALEATYIQVCSLAGFIKLASTGLSQFLLGIQRPTIVFVGTLVGIVANLFFNWLLIYGNWGFPAMGVAGAAWGTNAAVLMEFIVMGLYCARRPFVREYNTGDWRLRWSEFKVMIRVGIPSGFQLICDISAWAVFLNVIVGSFGTAALSATTFAFTYMSLCFMPAVGVGSAVTALVGNYIGMKRYDVAEQRAHLGFFLCAVYMVAVGLILFALRFKLMAVFSPHPEVQSIGATILVFVAIYQLFDAMFIVYVGAARGAGDTLVPAVVQAILVWTIVVGGGGLIAKYAPQFGVSGPWTLATIFGAILGIFLLVRFRRGGWKTIDLTVPPTSNVGDDSARLENSNEPVASATRL